MRVTCNSSMEASARVWNEGKHERTAFYKAIQAVHRLREIPSGFTNNLV